MQIDGHQRTVSTFRPSMMPFLGCALHTLLLLNTLYLYSKSYKRYLDQGHKKLRSACVLWVRMLNEMSPKMRLMLCLIE